MMHHRLIGLALCCLFLASTTDVQAAGRQRLAGKHAKAKAKTKASGQEVSPSNALEVAPARTSTGLADTRATESRAPLRESVRQESRIEFDERMLRGQSAAGVIYLFRRTPSDWKSIVAVPASFRERTVDLLAPTEDKK